MAGFLAMVPGIVWQYYRHSVLRIPGAYTTYAFFEWGLVIWDIAFDAVAISELSHIRVHLSSCLLEILLTICQVCCHRCVCRIWQSHPDRVGSAFTSEGMS